MYLFLRILGTALFVYFLILLARLVLDLVQMFSPSWRPRGIVLVFAEVVYTLTDPPLRALRRVIPPLRIGSVSLDLSFLVLILAVNILMQLVDSWARGR